MKTKDKSKKSTIEKLRQIRDKIGLDIENMSLEEMKLYFKKKKTLHPTWKE